MRRSGIVSQEHRGAAQQRFDFPERSAGHRAVFAEKGQILARSCDEYGFEIESFLAISRCMQEARGMPGLSRLGSDRVYDGVRLSGRARRGE
jgi:hypothetical protein